MAEKRRAEAREERRKRLLQPRIVSIDCDDSRLEPRPVDENFELLRNKRNRSHTPLFTSHFVSCSLLLTTCDREDLVDRAAFALHLPTSPRSSPSRTAGGLLPLPHANPILNSVVKWPNTLVSSVIYGNLPSGLLS